MEISITWVGLFYILLGLLVTYGPEWELEDGTPFMELSLPHQLFLLVFWPLPLIMMFIARWFTEED